MKKISGLEWRLDHTLALLWWHAAFLFFSCDYIIITSYPVGAGFMCRYPSSSSPELSSELMSPPTRTSTYSSWSSRLLPRERESSGISPSIGPREGGREERKGEREGERERERERGREREGERERGVSDCVCVCMGWEGACEYACVCETFRWGENFFTKVSQNHTY